MNRFFQHQVTKRLKKSSEYRLPLWLHAPWISGLLSATAVLAILTIMIVVFHLRNSGQLEDDLRHTLRRAAIAAAQTVDPVIHQTFVGPSQQDSPEYLRECARLERTRAAFEGPEKLEYVYTCILRDGQVRFVLDPSPSGDLDGDGLNDKAMIMELYDAPADALLATLHGGGVQVMNEMDTDRWGTFMSAYAPIYDDNGIMVAAAGVDLDLSYYSACVSGLRRDSLIAGGLGLLLSSGVGAAVAMYSRRLVDSVEQLRNSMEQAMVGERAKGRFLAIMSHEFRTPMNAIVGSTELLRGTRLDEFQAEQTQTILDSSSNLLAMLDDVLDYSREQSSSAKTEKADVTQICSNIISSFREAAEQKGLTMKVSVEPEVPARWLTHPGKLHRVLTHLISNAVKFTSHGGVTLKIASTLDPSGKPALLFAVADTGIGINPQDFGKIFSPFVQLDTSASRRHEGAGLGLAICERLCRELGTKLHVESESGKGSCFSFVLPGEAVGSHDRRAILITSDRLQRGITSRLLEKKGWRVQAVDTVDKITGILDSELVIFDLAAVPASESVQYAQDVVRRLPALHHLAIDAGVDQSIKDQVMRSGVKAIISRNPKSSSFDTLDFLAEHIQD